MNETDKKRLEEIQAELHAIDHGAAASRMNDDRTDEDTRWLISHLKDAMERESRVRELHPRWPVNENYCHTCREWWPCRTIAILDGGEG